MNNEKLINTVKSIYDWPISDEKIIEVYNNFKDIIKNGDEETVDFMESVIKFDKKQRMQYRNYLASIGFELRPNELDQYILLMIIAMLDMIEV
jgi:hypothetical protein